MNNNFKILYTGILILFFVMLFIFFNNSMKLSKENFTSQEDLCRADSIYRSNNQRICSSYIQQANTSGYFGRTQEPCIADDGKFGVVQLTPTGSQCISLDNLLRTNAGAEEEEEYVCPEEEEGSWQSKTGGDDDDTVYTTACYPKNTNFEPICKKQNSNYGVIRVIPCSDTSKSKAKCGANYVNGKLITDPMTPCLPKSYDFNTYCQYYVGQNQIPQNAIPQSIGTKELLVGKSGNCWTNGTPDNSLARGVCSTNYYDNVNKLDSILYTGCTKLDDNAYTSFYNQCRNLAKKNNKKCDRIVPYDIEGYDCKPLYGRAKCLTNTDITLLSQKNKDITDFNNNIHGKI
jgi:hypothetical protein